MRTTFYSASAEQKQELKQTKRTDWADVDIDIRRMDAEREAVMRKTHMEKAGRWEQEKVW